MNVPPRYRLNTAVTGLDNCTGCGLPLRGHDPGFHAQKTPDPAPIPRQRSGDHH